MNKWHCRPGVQCLAVSGYERIHGRVTALLTWPHCPVRRRARQSRGRQQITHLGRRRRRETDPSPSLALLKHRHCMPSRRTCWPPASATSSWITYYRVMAYLQRKLNNILQCLEKKMKFRSHVSVVVTPKLGPGWF